MQPIRRPHSVTIVSWLLILGGIFNGVVGPLLYMAINDENQRAEMSKLAESDPNIAKLMEQLSKLTIESVAAGVGVSMLYILGGVYMVQGAKWARRLSLGLLFFVTTATALTVPNQSSVVFVALISLLLAYGLLRKPANDYFNAEAPPTQPRE